MGFSPEREDPGNKKFSISKGNIPKIVSGYTNKCKKLVTLLYSRIAKTVKVNSIKEAEFTKLLENVYRAINISFVNEMKVIANGMNIDINNAIDAEILDEKFKGLQWITNRFMDNPSKELKLLVESKNVMKKSEFDYVIITDYQFFPMLLNLKQISPVKWYDAMSVPNKENIYHIQFKNYFKTNLSKQKIEYIYLIGKDKFPLDYLFKEENCVKFSRVNEILYLSNISKCY